MWKAFVTGKPVIGHDNCIGEDRGLAHKEFSFKVKTCSFIPVIASKSSDMIASPFFKSLLGLAIPS